MIKIRLFCISIIFLGCSQDLNKKDIPPSPVWVEKSRPADLEEIGIDAHNINLLDPGMNSIKLMWYNSPEDDVWKYHIYKTDILNQNNNPTEFSRIFTTESDTSFVDEYVDRYVYYYYYLTAENFEENESDASDTISYQLLNKPVAFSSSDSIQSESLQFQWIDENGGSFVPSGYVIRINDEFSESIWTCQIQPPVYFNPKTFNYSSGGIDCLEYNGISGYLDSGKYYWKVKSLLHNQASAESNWVEINIID